MMDKREIKTLYITWLYIYISMPKRLLSIHSSDE